VARLDLAGLEDNFSEKKIKVRPGAIGAKHGVARFSDDSTGKCSPYTSPIRHDMSREVAAIRADSSDRDAGHRFAA
jgi:hypothetical protein